MPDETVDSALLEKPDAAVIDADGATLGDTDLSADTRAAKVAAFHAFLSEASPMELLEKIEEGAAYLKKMIDAVPMGIQHAWHDVANEIRKRV